MAKTNKDTKRFKPLKGSSGRYIDTQTGAEISRRQRDKLLGVNEYRPAEEKAKIKKRAKSRFSKVGKMFYDTKTKETITGYEKRIRQAGGKEKFLETQKIYRESKNYAKRLPAKEVKALRERFGLAYENAAFLDTFDANGVPIPRIGKNDAVNRAVIFFQNSAETDLKKLSVIYKQKFLTMADYEDYIMEAFDAIGYNRPDFNRYV